MAAKRRRRKSHHKKHHRKGKGQVPVKLLNRRLVRLNNILTHRADGKSYSGSPS